MVRGSFATYLESGRLVGRDFTDVWRPAERALEAFRIALGLPGFPMIKSEVADELGDS